MASTPPNSPPRASSPPRSASPAKGFRSRVGTIMRRTSSGLAFNRSRSDSRSSLNSLKTDTQASSALEHTVPSPVMESPAREAAETSPMVHVHHGPSPLHDAATAVTESASVSVAVPVEPTPESTPAPAAEAVLVAEPESIPTAPVVPAEVVAESAASLEATADITAPVDAQPVPEATAPSEPIVQQDEYSADPIPEIEPVEIVMTASPEAQISVLSDHAPETIEQVVEPQPEVIEVVRTPAPVEATLASSSSPEPVAVPPSEPTSPPQAPPIERQPEKRGDSYFEWQDERAVAPKWSESNLASHAAEQDSQAVQADDATIHGPSPIHDMSNAQTYAWGSDTAFGKRRSSSSLTAQDSPYHSQEASRGSRSGVLSSKASRSSMASSYGQVVVTSQGKRVAIALEDDSVRRGRSSSVVHIDLKGNPLEDPFRDPPGSEPIPIPRHALSPVESIPDDQAGYTLPSIPQDSSRTESTRELSPSPQSFPLPPARDVISPSRKIRGMSSGYTLNEISTSQDHLQPDTDERQPLLPRSVTPPFDRKVQLSNQDASTSIAIAYPSAEQRVSRGSNGVHSMEALGWTEHILPDSSFYYSHKDLRITTDVDLRSQRKLGAITQYLERKRPDEVMLPPQGWELWLRDAGRTKHDFVPLRHWVNHKARILSFDPPPTHNGDSLPDHVTDDDRMDLEYRYWSYMETHPAHAPLPMETRAEAMDALTWSYTDCLLPSSKPVPPPFAPNECQELMGLFRSYDTTSKSGVVVHTRIVARVLLRVVQWRQQYFRPNKPLPRDTIRGPRIVQRRVGFARRVSDFLVALMCLGLPYLFMDRINSQRIDEEGGYRGSGPMLMVSACACLVAAVILSASVTFISLPALDDGARLAGLLAIVFSASSMVSTVIALFRYKADVQRTVVYVGYEGVTMLSRRSVLMSLPLVFLAWAIAAFMTGITFYSFRGAALTSRTALKHPFVDYTHWAVVGSIGGLGGMLLVSALLARR